MFKIALLFRYDCQGQLVEPFLIGICGGSASGKTTVADKIIKVQHRTIQLKIRRFESVFNLKKSLICDQMLCQFHFFRNLLSFSDFNCYFFSFLGIGCSMGDPSVHGFVLQSA